jgi:hypothetical protein
MNTSIQYTERVDHYRNEVREGLDECYEELLSQGCAPKIAAGVLEYLAERYTGDATWPTQEDVAEQYGFTPATIRNWTTEIEDAVLDALDVSQRTAAKRLRPRSKRTQSGSSSPDRSAEESSDTQGDADTRVVDDSITLTGAFHDIVIQDGKGGTGDESDATTTETLLGQTADDIDVSQQSAMVATPNALIFKDALTERTDHVASVTRGGDAVWIYTFHSADQDAPTTAYKLPNGQVHIRPGPVPTDLELCPCRLELLCTDEHGFIAGRG